MWSIKSTQVKPILQKSKCYNSISSISLLEKSFELPLANRLKEEALFQNAEWLCLWLVHHRTIKKQTTSFHSTYLTESSAVCFRGWWQSKISKWNENTPKRDYGNFNSKRPGGFWIRLKKTKLPVSWISVSLFCLSLFQHLKRLKMLTLWRIVPTIYWRTFYLLYI